MKRRRTPGIHRLNTPPTFTLPDQGTPHLAVYFHGQLSTQPFVSHSEYEQFGSALREMKMMTGRRTCDEVTFGVDPSKRLTTSDHSQLSQAQLYPSSARTPPRLAVCRPPSARDPLAVPSCSGSGRDAPPRRSLPCPAAHRPTPSHHKGSSGAGVTGLWPRAAKLGSQGQGPE